MLTIAASAVGSVLLVFASFVPGCRHRGTGCVSRELGPVQTTPWGTVREIRCTRAVVNGVPVTYSFPQPFVPPIYITL